MEKMLKEKQLEFLNETIGFYNSSNRSVINQNGCLYFHPTLEGCAIGRKIKDKELCMKLDSFECTGVCEDEVFELLPNDLKELGMKSLNLIQVLHDGKGFWNENGLTEEGLKEVENIKNFFNLNG